MVQRYRFNYVQEMFETETGEQHNETERGEWIKYKDYAVLHDLLREVLDNIDPYWDLADGTQDKLDKLGYLDD